MDPFDHRQLAQRLDLFHFQDDAPGMVFWHPRGWILYRLLEETVRRQLDAHGYREVRTPQVLRRPIWEASGHWEHFSEGMLRIEDQSVQAALKPVSCPGHVQIVKRGVLSWRDLPLRLAEFGLVHRDEPSGTLHGLLRLRQFTQDDGHVFCSDEHVVPEIERFSRSLAPFYRSFGFEQVSVALSTRPEQRAGSDELWDQAEGWLAEGARAAGLQVELQPGAGAFYGPKLEFVLSDRLGRQWQCGTIQVDLVMPRRFEVRYTDRSGERPHVVMLHRALYGSLERFLGILLEQHGAQLPPWFAPEQVQVIPVGPEQRPQAAALAERLARSGLRASCDDREETLGKRIASAHEAAIPFLAILGAREVESGAVALRSRAGQKVLPQEAALAELASACAVPG
jgi:threonyl-tRNA synthetase